jgi:hypothetical protein
MLSEVRLANKNESEQTNMNINKNKRNKILSYIIGIYLVLGFTGRVVLAESADSTLPMTMEQIALTGDRMTKQALAIPTHVVEWKHGDISWLPELAAAVGWPKHTWKKLGQIILRESGGCPNRIGGSIVDKNCNIVGHTGATNKSDSGLLQINGVNWDPKRSGRQLLCAEHQICKQEQLLDPVTNLRAGYILYQKAGWDPWDPCAWGPEYAHRCKASK